MRKFLFPLVVVILLLAEIANASTHIFINASGGGGLLTWDQTQAGNWNPANVNTCVAGGGAGVSENSYGVMSGVNLTYTQVGNIAGVSGGKRALDGSDDCFTVTTAFVDNFLAKDNCVVSIIHKIDTFANAGTDNVTLLDLCADASGNNRIRVFTSSGRLKADFADGGTDYWPFPADTIPTTGTLYIYVATTTTEVKIGWHTALVGGWGEIPAGQQASVAHVCTWAGVSFTQGLGLVGATTGGLTPMQCSWYWTIIADQTLEQMAQ
ncbi:MAG: hypothetical protein PHC68_00380 [Syntrophorhabdaceae bacterium]|nr:hypothetical protein [Syntrophorhabdaceae bacterium]